MSFGPILYVYNEIHLEIIIMNEFLKIWKSFKLYYMTNILQKKSHSHSDIRYG